jgi:hypothetical protein
MHLLAEDSPVTLLSLAPTAPGWELVSMQLEYVDGLADHVDALPVTILPERPETLTLHYRVVDCAAAANGVLALPAVVSERAGAPQRVDLRGQSTSFAGPWQRNVLTAVCPPPP